jgi:hypothetical protein
MRIDREKKTVFLTEEDLQKSFCPLRPRWGIKILEMYGIEKVYKSELVESLRRCPEILKNLGYKVINEETGKEL